MIPLTICLENCIELIPDQRRRVLESEARKFAENGFLVRNRFKTGATYFGQVLKEHEKILWRAAYYKRKARLQRMKNVPGVSGAYPRDRYPNGR